MEYQETNTEMNKYGYTINILTLLAVILLSVLFVTQSKAQTVFYNGGLLHTDGASLLYVDGDIQNKDTAHIENDGVIELTGNLTNDNTAKMVNGADDASTERVYKFIGTGV